MEFQSFCIFSCILTLVIILIKPITIKAYDRRASGDCGTSGIMRNIVVQFTGESFIVHVVHNGSYEEYVDIMSTVEIYIEKINFMWCTKLIK